MATPIPLNFRAAPLPPNFKGNPEQLKEAIVSRLSAESSVDIQFFTSGPIVPTSDYGPWLKDDKTWYVWDTTTAAYIPQVMEFESLKYLPSATAPSQAKYTFWIELDGTGKAIDIKYYSGGAWKSIFEDKFAQYATIAQLNAAISGASSVQTGQIVMYPRVAPPSGWLNCDGSAVDRTVYSALFALIGTTYGGGDGIATFNLPNFNGRAPVGIGLADEPTSTTPWSIGQLDGSSKHVLTQAELPDIEMKVTMPMYDEGGAFDNNIANGGAIANKQVTIDLGNLGSGAGHNNVQPSIGINFIIKT
jgi:microcystin-dependent protein